MLQWDWEQIFGIIYTHQVRYLYTSSAAGRPSILAAVNQITKHTDWLQRLLVNLLPSLLNKVISTEVHEEVSGHIISAKIPRILYVPAVSYKEAFKT